MKLRKTVFEKCETLSTSLGYQSIFQVKLLISTRALAFLVCICSLVCHVRLVAADEPIQRYFSALRARALYVTAEQYALVKLQEANITPSERAVLTVELSQCLLEHGATTTGKQREEYWTEAENVVQKLQKEFGPTFRQIYLGSQRARIHAFQGRTLAWEAELFSDSELRNQANQKLKSGEIVLSNVLQAISKWEAPSDVEIADGALTVEQQEDLEKEIRFELAGTLMELGRLHIGPQQQSYFERADNEFGKLRDSEYQFAAQLSRAKMARLAGNADRATGALKQLLDEQLTQPQQDRILAEQIRIEIDEGKPDQALELLRVRLRETSPVAHETRAAAVEALLAAWKLAKKKNDAQLQTQLLTEARNQSNQIEGRWKLFTQNLLRRLTEEMELGTDLAQAVREARNAFQQQNFANAIQMFRQAATIAANTSQADKAVEYLMTAGSIAIQQKLWRQASDSLQGVVDTYSQSQQAPKASLLLCYSLGQQAQQSNTDSSQQAYLDALQAHRQKFAESPTSVDVTWMLAVALEQQGPAGPKQEQGPAGPQRFQEALKLYAEIPSNHAKRADADLRSIALLQQRLQAQRDANESVESLEVQVFEFIQQLQDRYAADYQRLTVTQCQVAMRVAQVLLSLTERQYGAADRWLEVVETSIATARSQARAQGESLPADWKSIQQRSRQMRIVSLAGQQRLPDALKILNQIGESDPVAMLRTLQGLTELTSQVDPNQVRQLGFLQRQIIDQIAQRRNQLDQTQQRLLDECDAEAYVATGDLPEAAEIYEKLIKQYRERRLIDRVVEIYMRRGAESDLKRAKSWWTHLESKAKPGSTDWLKARFEIALILGILKQETEALKLLRVTKTLYPKLGSPQLHSDYEELETELQARLKK